MVFWRSTPHCVVYFDQAILAFDVCFFFAGSLCSYSSSRVDFVDIISVTEIDFSVNFADIDGKKPKTYRKNL